MKRLLTSLAVALLLVSTLSAQVAVAPIIQPKPQFFDNNGVPCAGCSLYTYAGGTTNPLPTYTDSTGTVANPNPLVLNASGRPSSEIWLGASVYKFVFKDASGATMYTVDNVKSLASVPPFTSGFTGTGSTGTYTAGSGITATSSHYTAAQTFDNINLAKTTYVSCTGTSDAPALQTALNTYSKVVIASRNTCGLGLTALVIPANTELDLNGSTLSITSGNGMVIQNAAAAAAAQRTCAVSFTSGSKTISTSACNFTSADVNLSIMIPGANITDTAGSILTATIVSVGGTTSATLNLPAQATSSSTASLYNRDSNITVKNGFISGPGGGRDTTPVMNFGRVDGLLIQNISLTTSHSINGILQWDVNRSLIDNTYFNVTTGDLIHTNGPASDITIRHTRGSSTDDDGIAFTAHDWTSAFLGGTVNGPISNVLVEDTNVVSATNEFKIVGGTSQATLTNFVIRNTVNNSQYQAIDLDSDINSGGATYAYGILIDGLQGNPWTTICPTNGKDITIKNVTMDWTGSGLGGIQTGYCQGNNAAIVNIDSFTIDGYKVGVGVPVPANSTSLVDAVAPASSTINHFALKNLHLSTNVGVYPFHQQTMAVFDRRFMDWSIWYCPAGSGCTAPAHNAAIYLENGSSVNSTFSNLYMKNQTAAQIDLVFGGSIDGANLFSNVHIQNTVSGGNGSMLNEQQTANSIELSNTSIDNTVAGAFGTLAKIQNTAQHVGINNSYVACADNNSQSDLLYATTLPFFSISNSRLSKCNSVLDTSTSVTSTGGSISNTSALSSNRFLSLAAAANINLSGISVTSTVATPIFTSAAAVFTGSGISGTATNWLTITGAGSSATSYIPDLPCDLSDPNLLKPISAKCLNVTAASGPLTTMVSTGASWIPIVPLQPVTLTTTAAASDVVTITGMTSAGHCTLTATNASAATNIATTYVSAKTTNQITVSHTASAGMTYDVACRQN